MDLGEAIWAGITATGAVGLGAHMWRTRRPASPVVLPARSHVRRVPAKSCVDSGDAARPATDAPAGSSESTHAPSLALAAYSTIAGGTQLEARLETARRMLASHRTFGDQAVRRRPADPEIAAALAIGQDDAR